MTFGSQKFRRVIALCVVVGASLSTGMLLRGGQFWAAVVAGAGVCLFNLTMLACLLLSLRVSRSR